MKYTLSAALLLGNTAWAIPQNVDVGNGHPTYKNPSASITARVNDLVGRMNITEKMAQLMQGDVSNWLNTDTYAFNYSGLVANMAEKAGSFYVGYPITWDELANGIQLGQSYLENNTRFGIPAFVQTEGIHGFLIGNATIFNSPIGYASSWNTKLVNQMAQVIGQEARAFGVNQLFAPLGDLAREQRYGRVEETFGEDPFLAGEIAYNYVTGVQSQNVSATVKHFAAYSMPEQGINCGPVHGGERELRQTWLPSYKRAIIDGGAYSIMSAYSSYDGVPLISNAHIITEILRNEWGYKYWVTSDAGATDRLWNAFSVCQAQNAACVVSQALTAGTDVEMGGGSFNYRAIPAMVANGTLQMSVVNTAVSRILTAKFAMGLFDKSNLPMSADQINQTVHTQANQDVARQLDTESIVLLQNPNKVLPLDKNAKVAVIGPMAYGYMNYGDYVVYQSQYRGVTPLDGIRAAAASPDLITYAQGCERWSPDESGIAAAVAAAEAADVAVVVVGTWSRDQGQLWTGLNATTGESVDVDDLDLVGAMRPLAQAIVNTGKPTVIVMSSGKPVTETWISNTDASFLQQFYPSEQGGNALADVLYGNYNPSGRLSISFPHSVGDLPIYYDYQNSGREVWDIGSISPSGALNFGRQYVLGSPEPWFPFGFGLSYTNFTYSDFVLSATQVSSTDTVTATVSVSNTGGVDGDEVVQLYVKQVLASVDIPNMRLKGFWKGTIPAGQTQTVSIEVNVADLGLWNVNYDYVVEGGEYRFMVGRSSAAGDLGLVESIWVQ